MLMTRGEIAENSPTRSAVFDTAEIIKSTSAIKNNRKLMTRYAKRRRRTMQSTEAVTTT